MKIISSQDIYGHYFESLNKQVKGTVIIFGGSDGGLCDKKAKEMSENGYNSVACAYFKQKNLQQNLINIDLKFFAKLLALLKEEEMYVKPLVVIGSSKGAELVLLLSTYYEEIDKIVLYTPSSYHWQNPNGMIKAPTFTYGNKNIPYVRFKIFNKVGFEFLRQMIGKKPVVLRKLYTNSIMKSKNLENSRIKVENFKGSICLFAGDDDQMWPSDRMIKTIVKYHPNNIIYKVYEQVGHIIGGSSSSKQFVFGGIDELNKQAEIDSDNILYEFLDS